jgi:hypothetical protein
VANAHAVKKKDATTSEKEMLIFWGVRMHRGSLGRLVMSPALAVLSVFNGKSYIGESGASSTSTTGTRHRS